MSKFIGSIGSLSDGVVQSTSSFLPNSSKFQLQCELGVVTALYRQRSQFRSWCNKEGTEKKEMIERKIGYLLETDKKQDELSKKANDGSSKKREDRKKLRNKFGFSDDEDDDTQGIQDDDGSEISGFEDVALYSQT